MLTRQPYPRLGAAVAVLCLAVAGAVKADSVTYTIDSTSSALNLSGSFSGFSFVPQSPGAMSNHFSGQLTADANGGVLIFSGGSSIIGNINPAGLFQPLTGGAEGSAPGNYGVMIPAIGEFGAYRSIIFDIPSATIMNNAAPGGTLMFLQGVLDYAGPATGPGQLNFASVSGGNNSQGLVSLTSNGGIETLSLPFTFAMSDANGLQQTFDGTIVATRTLAVPEPSLLLLGLVGGVMLFGLCGFRHIRSRRI